MLRGKKRIMDDFDESNFNALTIKSFSPQKLFHLNGGSSTVFHYTSPEACLQILRSKCIRFSDVQYMNDRAETIYSVKVVLDFLEKQGKDFPNCFEFVGDLLKYNDLSKIRNLTVDRIIYDSSSDNRERRQFVFCTSTDSDSLSMWNYYVHNGAYQGYNIGFNILKFLRTFDTDSSQDMNSFMVYYGKVLYTQKKQFEEIRHFFEETEKNFRCYSAKDRGWAEAWIKSDIKHKLRLYGLFFKHPAFQHEKEFRVVVATMDKQIPRSQDDANGYFGKNNRHMIEDYYTRGGVIVPYLRIMLPDNCISHITISPTTEVEIAERSLREVADISGFKNVQYTHSCIPIRY